jgi:hypothetical protein
LSALARLNKRALKAARAYERDSRERTHIIPSWR